MAVVDEIFRSWRRPGDAVRRQLPVMTEARALSYLLVAALMIIISQAPWLARQAHLDPKVPFEARMLAAALGILAVLPVSAYFIAALSHIVMRIFGGDGEWLGARLALFWTLLAMAPLFLLNGMVAGLIGPGPQLNIVGALLVAGFGLHWVIALVATQKGNM